MDKVLEPNTETPGPGAIARALVDLSLPIVLANLLQACHQLVNTFWVGRLGAQAVAAVSISFPIVFLITSLGAGLSIAGSILVAQHAGARDWRMVNHVAAQTLLMVALASSLLSAAGYLATPLTLRLIGVGDEVFADAVHYMHVSFLGVAFTFIFFMFQAVLRGIGEVKFPLFLVAVGVLINLALDPLFIFGWGPVPAGGVAGAAYATFAAQALVAGVGLGLLFGRSFGIQLRRRDLVPDGAAIRRLLTLGLPASIEQSMQALGITAMTAIVSSFGTIAMAAYGISFRVYSFVIIPAFGISMAASTLVGQSIGAGNVALAERIALSSARMTCLLLSAITVLLYLGAGPLVRLFAPDNAQLLQEGSAAVRYMSLSYSLIGIQFGLIGAFRGAGDTFLPMAQALVGTWLVQLPLAWMLSKQTMLTTDGIWLSYPLCSLATTLFVVQCFRSGRWKRRRLTAPRGRAAPAVLVEESRP